MDPELSGLLIPIILRLRQVYDEAKYVSGDIWKNVVQAYSCISEPIRDTHKRKRLSKVFGIGQEIFVYPGPDHPSYKGPHPDNMDCAKSLSCALAEKTLGVTTQCVSVPVNRPLYILGGTTSTSVVKNIMGRFERGKLVVPSGELPMVFEWYFTSPGWPDKHYMVKSHTGKQLREDWGHRLIDKNGNMLTDKIRVDRLGYQLDDWLLIMRLPNLITEKAYREGREILIIAGAQGAGTKAFLPLITQRMDEVERLIKATGDSRYYQAIFKIDDVYHDGKKRQSLAEPDSITFHSANVLQHDKERIEYWFRMHSK